MGPIIILLLLILIKLMTLDIWGATWTRWMSWLNKSLKILGYIGVVLAILYCIGLENIIFFGMIILALLFCPTMIYLYVAVIFMYLINSRYPKNGSLYTEKEVGELILLALLYFFILYKLAIWLK